jgi:disulfide bond formation protein DsbB
MTGINPRLACALAALAAGFALGTAFAFEWWGGLVPCALCLVERWPYRVAIGLGVVGVLLPGWLPRLALVGVLLAGLASVGAAGLHVGVEFGWWPSPLPECAAPHFEQGSIADRLRSMPDVPSKACEDMVFPIEAIPISFAQAGLIYAALFSAGVAVLLVKTGRRER